MADKGEKHKKHRSHHKKEDSSDKRSLKKSSSSAALSKELLDREGLEKTKLMLLCAFMYCLSGQIALTLDELVWHVSGEKIEHGPLSLKVASSSGDAIYEIPGPDFSGSDQNEIELNQFTILQFERLEDAEVVVSVVEESTKNGKKKKSKRAEATYRVKQLVPDKATSIEMRMTGALTASLRLSLVLTVAGDPVSRPTSALKRLDINQVSDYEKNGREGSLNSHRQMVDIVQTARSTRDRAVLQLSEDEYEPSPATERTKPPKSKTG